MAEYVLKPDKTHQPPGSQLIKKLQLRGFRVEFHLKGSDKNWESIRIFQMGPPELDCQILFDREIGRYKITVSRDASLKTRELQLFLVDILLKDLGGQVDNTTTLERFSPLQFASQIKSFENPMKITKDLIWIGFSWSVVMAGFIVLFAAANQFKGMVAMILFFSSVSAVGLTYSHFKNE